MAADDGEMNPIRRHPKPDGRTLRIAQHVRGVPIALLNELKDAAFIDARAYVLYAARAAACRASSSPSSKSLEALIAYVAPLRTVRVISTRVNGANSGSML